MYFRILLSLCIVVNTVYPCDPTAAIRFFISIPWDKLTNSSLAQSKQAYDAFMARDFEQFSILIDNNVTFKYKDPKTGRSVLHEIAQQDETDYLECIIKRKKLFSAKNNTPYFFSQERGYADAEMQDKEGKTPLHYAAESGSVHVAQMLIACQVDLNKADKKANVPLFYALEKHHLSFIDLLKDNIDLINWHKLCTEYKNSKGWMAIHYACKGNVTDYIDHTLYKKPDLLNVKTAVGHTPLHIALKNENFQLAERLINNPATQLRIQNAKGNTALHYAVEQQNTDLIDLIIKKDDLTQTISNAKNETPFALAYNNNWQEAQNHFIKKYVKDSAYILDIVLSEKTDAALIENLLHNGASTSITTPDGQTPLAVAAKKLNITAVKAIKKYAPESINTLDNNHNLPLHSVLQSLIAQQKKALSQEDKELVHTLLTNHPVFANENNIPLRNNSGDSVLDLAARLSSEITSTILKHTPSGIYLINNPHPKTGYSLFLHACKKGDVELIKMFSAESKAHLEQPVDNPTSDFHGYTPLLLAAAHGHADAYDYLTELGCTKTARGQNGKNLAFLLIEQKEKIDPEGKRLTHFLNSFGQSALEKMVDGTNLLHIAVEKNNETAYTFLSAQYNTLIHDKDNEGSCPMHTAIATNNTQALRLMKNYGGIPSTVLNKDNANYLFCALKTDNADIVCLCAVPELIHSTDLKTDLHPLEWVITKGKNHLIKTLLQCDADPALKNKSGSNALDISVTCTNQEAFDILLPRLSYTDQFNALKIATTKKDYYFEQLLKNIPQEKHILFFNNPLYGTDCFLRYAIHNNLNSKISVALELGLNPNESFTDGTLPLHYAAHVGKESIIELITTKRYCNNPASIHSLDRDGRNGLMIACLYGHADAASYFLRRKIDPKIQAENGKTALHFAAQSGNTTIIKRLLEEGLDTNQKDTAGNSPLLIAALHSKIEAIHMLTQDPKINIDLINNKGEDVCTILKNEKDKASFFQQDTFENTIHYIQNKKIDLGKERQNLNNVYGTVLALQQENQTLSYGIKQYAPHAVMAYQPAPFSPHIIQLTQLPQEQIKKEAEKLEQLKKQEETQHNYLLSLWQQLQPQPQYVYNQSYYGEPNNGAGVYYAEPSAPPAEETEQTDAQEQNNDQQNQSHNFYTQNAQDRSTDNASGYNHTSQPWPQGAEKNTV